MRHVRLIPTSLTLVLTLSFTLGCAGRGPERVTITPSHEYFLPVEKPRPRSDAMRDVVLFTAELSESWDNLYQDRLAAWAEIKSLESKE